MNQYRKKPVVVEAIQWNGENEVEVSRLMNEKTFSVQYPENTITIFTFEGEMKANLGDWIIKGVKGEFYPVKPDIFKETYDLVSEGTDR